MSKLKNSSRRSAANKENAKLSTGPRTPQGKAVSSQNARKFKDVSLERLIEGLLLKGECKDGLRVLVNQHVADFSPQNPTEYGIVEQMAGVISEIERLQISKRTILDTLAAKEPSTLDNVKIARALDIAFQSKGYLNLDRAIGRLRRDYSNLATTLTKVRKLRADSATKTAPYDGEPDPLEYAEAPETNFHQSNPPNEIFMGKPAPKTPATSVSPPLASVSCHADVIPPQLQSKPDCEGQGSLPHLPLAA